MTENISQPNIRDIAIIAHVDHGKTTLIDGLLKQSHTFRDNESAMQQNLILDSGEQERERGITIVAKNTAISYQGVKINIIDTPGHADFGGEVERTLNMADGAILLVDAHDGPMPQTKFVLKKALELNLKPIVVINKIDRSDANIDEVIKKTHDLFLDLATQVDQLDFPLLFAIGREGKAWKEQPADINQPADLSPILQTIIDWVPAAKGDNTGGLQLLATALDWDNYLGKLVIGRVHRGVIKSGQAVVLIGEKGIVETTKIDRIYINQGLKRIEVNEAPSGEIVAVSGVKNAKIGDTISEANVPEALPRIKVEEPTLRMTVSANTSPFAGREGKYVTGRHILDRIKKELETNVSMRLEYGSEGEYILCGRGELHLSVFIESLRREGYELQVAKPRVISRIINGHELEPLEELTIDLSDDYLGTVTAEIGKRKGMLKSQSSNGDGSSRLVFEITTRGIIGLSSQLLTLSHGTAVFSSIFLDYVASIGILPKLRNGVLIASQSGKAVTYGLDIAQGRGITFIYPQTEVYEGMIIGENSREQDIEINVAKEKKLTNVRSSTQDISTILTPPTVFSLEQAIDFLEEDELLEVTPKSLRLRKKFLTILDRAKSKRLLNS